jgi:putative redox protein
MKVKAKLLENVSSVADNTRKHTVTLDLPPAKGGDDKGPTALELALMSLADCAVTIYADVAKKSKVTLKNLEAEVEAEQPPGSPVIKNVSLRMTIESDARKGMLEALWRRTEANCPVVAIFKEAMPIKANLEIVRQ